MFGRRSCGVAGAAILGSLALLATGVAHAIVDLDAEDKSKASVTFAKELLKASTKHGDVDYYTVTATGGSGDSGLVKAKLGAVVGADRNAVVTFTFQNLVFLHDSTAPTISFEDSAGTDVSGVNDAHFGGGTRGMNTVSYRLSPTAELPADTVLFLGVPTGGVGISASAPVSITMDLTAEPAQEGGDPVTYQVSHPIAIDARPALKVTSTPNSPVASVEDGYRKFKAGPGVSSDRLTASLGRITVSAEPYLKPDGTAVGENDIWSAGFATWYVLDDDEGLAGVPDQFSSAIVRGDFSFASSAATSVDCPPLGGWTGPDMRRSDDQSRLRIQYGRAVDARLLCIGVSGGADATPIARTAPYVAEFSFIYTDDVNPDLVPTTASASYGSIGRDGAMVRIPYLVTDERYNQRIVIVNHGAATNYEMSFTSEEGITAQAGMESSGTLPSGTTVLRTSDVVTIEGGPPHRVSGTLTIEAVAGSVSVATNQTNRSNGSTDTVVYKVQGQ